MIGISWRTRLRCFWVTGLLMINALSHLSQARGNEVDKYTLLFADFEEDAYQAKYAQGWDRFSGRGAHRIEGYRGKGLDLNKDANPTMQWAFWPKGNVRYQEGTIEMWFRASSDPSLSPSRDFLFNFYAYQPLRPAISEKLQLDPNLPILEAVTKAHLDGKIQAIQPYFRLNRNLLSYLFVTRSGEVFKNTLNFAALEGLKRELSPEEWHHLALVWAGDIFQVYLDGRIVTQHIIPNAHGLAFAADPQRPVGIEGVAIDDFRISSVGRYSSSFEPDWRDRLRPAYAFSGIPSIIPQSIVSTEPDIPEIELWTGNKSRQIYDWDGSRLEFDEETGRLTSFGDGATTSHSLTEGLRISSDKKELSPKINNGWKREGDTLIFDQIFSGEIRASQEITKRSDSNLNWKIVLKNESSVEQKIEVSLGMPIPFGKLREVFDSSKRQSQLQFSRRRDEYVYSMPFVAAATDDRSFGLGIFPSTNLSSLIGEFIPVGDSGVVRQGTKIVLSPGESITLPYLITARAGRFLTMEALDEYHKCFPELYKQDPKVPKYSYLGVAEMLMYINTPDILRTLYVGNQWGHGPYHTKGDYMGTPKYWDQSKYDGRVDYVHAQRNQRLYRTVENLHEQIVKASKESFEYYYSLRRSHDVPNLTGLFIVEDVWPGFNDKDDPMVSGQYYLPATGIIVDEYHTPLGEKFLKDQNDLMGLIGRYSPGFINDMCQISPYRFVDDIAKQVTGRSFSDDRGIYLVGAFGHVNRYEMINKYETDNYRQSMWSDFGIVSYMLSAHSSADAIEAGEKFTGPVVLEQGLETARYLLGEKPLVCLASPGADYVGRFYAPDKLTPVQLRDYYRKRLSEVMLISMKCGMYLDPFYLQGFQEMIETNAMLTESISEGRKIISGAKVSPPLWVVRGGEKWKSLWVVGNETDLPQKGSLEIYADYFDSKSPVVVDYFGESVQQEVKSTETVISNIPLDERSVQGFKAIANMKLTSSAMVNASMSGEGGILKANIDIKSDQESSLELASFQPLYQMETVRLDGGIVEPSASGQLSLKGGNHKITIIYRLKAARFDEEDWKRVELIKNGKANFALIGSSTLGFENGTAMQLNFFLDQYDEEDGRANGLLDSLNFANIYDSDADLPSGYDGWVVKIVDNASSGSSGIHIEKEKKLITVAGETPGDARRYMNVFMRLVDRKYPHIGRPYPMRTSIFSERLTLDELAGVRNRTAMDTMRPWQKLIGVKETKAFFEAFSEKDFPELPVFRSAYENLYADGNRNFEGKYQLKVSPWLIEPTYECEYVYGQNGNSNDNSNQK